MLIDRMRRFLRRALPESLRLRLAEARRGLRDIARGDVFCPAAAAAAGLAPEGWLAVVAISQPIRRSAHWQGKLHNLRLAAARLDGTVCASGQVLSLWRLLGRPDIANGYAMGRSIRNGRVEADAGGGLCQISGLLYELGLRAGMKIAERHPHTQDLYTEDSRFTPLGLDATVVFGHKDMRLRNVLAQPLGFAFAVDGERIEGRMLAGAPLAPCGIEIVRRDDAAGTRRVDVWRSSDETRALVSRDSYAATPAAPASYS